MGSVLRINNFNMSIHRKIQYLGEGWFTKKTVKKEDCLKRGLGQLTDLIGGLAKKKRCCF